MKASASAQRGSASGVVILVVVAVFLWWQWDWISGFLGGGGGALELVDYRCDPQSGGMRFDGSVRNASDKPVELKAVTAIYDSSGKKSDYRDATVRPTPLPAGAGRHLPRRDPAAARRGGLQARRLHGRGDRQGGRLPPLGNLPETPISVAGDPPFRG